MTPCQPINTFPPLSTAGFPAQKCCGFFILKRDAANGIVDAEFGFAAAFFAELQTKQEPLGHDFEKVLYENLWDLYES